MAKFLLLFMWYKKFLYSGILVFVATVAIVFSHHWIDFQIPFKNIDDNAVLTIVIPNDDKAVILRDSILEILDTNQSISHIKEPPTNKVRKILEKWIGKENIGLIPVPKVIEVFHHLNKEPDWNNLKEEILLKAPGAWVVLVDNSKEDNKWKNYIFFLMAIIIYLLFIGIIIRKNILQEKKIIKLERLLGASDKILIYRSVISSWSIILFSSLLGCFFSLFFSVLIKETYLSNNILFLVIIITINSMIMSFLSSLISTKEILRDTP